MALRHGAWHGCPSQASRAPSDSTVIASRSLIGVDVRRKRSAMLARRYLHCGRVDFEKWQALGNDYLIVEASALPFELTPGRIRALCAPHTGVFADGILLLSEPDDARSLARLRDLQSGRVGGGTVGQRGAGGDPLPARSRLDRRGRVLAADRGRAGPRADHLRQHLHGRDGTRPRAQRRLPAGLRGWARRAGGRRAHLELSARSGRQSAMRDRGCR